MSYRTGTFRALPLWLLCSILCACETGTDTPALSGYIEAEFVYVAAPQPGWIIRQTVREGDTVQPGDILFELEQGRETAQQLEADARLQQKQEVLLDISKGARLAETELLEAELQVANARLELATVEKDRWEKTTEQALSSRSQRDVAVAEYQAARAQVLASEKRIEIAGLAARDHALSAAQAEVAATAAGVSVAEWELAQRTVRAGAGGVIDEIYYRTGEFVQAGAPVYSILLTHTRKVRFYLPQARLPEIRLGTEVRITVDGIQEYFTATISHIASDAEFTPPVLYGREARDRLVFLVEADLEQGNNLNPGQPVDVSF